MINTTNIVERIFRKVKRRTRSIGVFANRDSLIRVLYSVFKEYNEKEQLNIKNAKITISSLNQIYTQIGTRSLSISLCHKFCEFKNFILSHHTALVAVI